MARHEMATITAERGIKRSLSRKLPPLTQYLIEHSGKVRVYREEKKSWEGPFTVTKATKR